MPRPSTNQIARDISYASSAHSKAGRAFIRAVENATGRIRMIKRAKGYEAEVAQGRDFWQVMVERYGLSLNVVGGSLENIPRDGPLIVIANHPYGILDGLVMGHILSSTRDDFRILAHQVFRKAEDLDRSILPVSFDDSKEAVKTNIETRKAALQYLSDGGAIGVFPGGTVSTANRPFATPLDPEWRGFTARMVAKSNARVVPVFFNGANSRMFQIASHLHMSLRLAMLIREFKERVDAPVDIVVGAPLCQDKLNAYGKDTKAMMDFLRQETYKLGPRPMQHLGYGFEFDDKRRGT